MVDVTLPDIGSDDPVDLVEILVKVGDTIAAEDSLMVVESAKASVEVPAPSDGVVESIHVKVGQSLKQGDLLMNFKDSSEQSENTAGSENTSNEADQADEPSKDDSEAEAQPEEDAQPAGEEQEVAFPDIGSDSADIIELPLQAGDSIAKEQTVAVLESDKATVDVPSDIDGTLVRYLVKVGDSVSQGTPYAVITRQAETSPKADSTNTNSPQPKDTKQPSAEPKKTAEESANTQSTNTQSTNTQPTNIAKPTDTQQANTKPQATDANDPVNLSSRVHAGPAVRRLANQLGVALDQVSTSGPKGRALKEDVHAYVKQQMTQPAKNQAAGVSQVELPTIDFSQFGHIETQDMSRLQQLSAANLHRAWTTIPHVTQFDQADITELEAFRKSIANDYKDQGIKVTMLAFMIKASVLALKAFPKFNASLNPDGKTLVIKNYYHIGFAADTPYGLVVPVIRNADQLSVVEIAEQLGDLSKKARDKKLKPQDMQGGCFSISSLGGIGGTAFTPIVNWPEVAILGVSRSQMQPQWNGTEFKPKMMLPISLSYDHRVIDGADAARFAQFMVKLLSDARRMLL